MYSVNVLRCCVTIFFLLRAGFAVEFGISSGMISTVRDLLIDLNWPLKLTIASCWSLDETVHIVRHITSGPKNFQIKIVDVTNPVIIPNIIDRHQELILADLHCGNTANIFSQINSSMFNFYKIIVFDSSVSMQNNSNASMDTKIRRLFRTSPIMPMSRVFFISENFAKSQFSVKQVYRLGLTEPLIIDDLTFSNVKTTDLSFALSRRDFKGFQFKASMVLLNDDSVNHLDDYRDTHIDAVAKVSYHLTNHLIKFLNASVKYSIVDTWGYQKTSADNCTGMLGELFRGEADIGATPLFFTPERVAILEFISRPTSARGGFVFQAPKLSYTNNIYALPFDGLLWMCLVFLVIVITMFLCGAVIIELKVFKGLEISCQLNDAYMIVYGAVCQQGANVVPNSVTGRFITAIAFISLMFLFVSYSANIVALLQSPSNQIKTIRDLYETKMDASVEDTPYFRYFFPLATETVRKKFFDEKVCNKNGKCKFITLEEGVRKIREGQHAYYSELSSIYKIVGDTFLEIEKCSLQEIPFFQIRPIPWYVLAKNSSYKEILKIGMMRVKEHGLQQKENLRYFIQKPKCEGGGGNFVSVSLIDAGPAVALLGWGVGTTVFVFICEIIVAKFEVIRKFLLSIGNRL